MKRFNVTSICVPGKHYMVDIGGKIAEIKKLVDDGYYFTINRARQYGKTTTLHELEKKLAGEYTVASISFERFGDESFASAEKFCPAFIRRIVRALRFTSAEAEYIERWADYSIADFDSLSDHITDMCEGKTIILMIDEVDKISNNRVFLHFLSTLRDKYTARNAGKDHTFHSVILAGVYDIKNIKVKMIKEGLYTPLPAEDKIHNSPWNIAVDFDVDMSFGPAEIAGMLAEYEADHKTGMDIAAVAGEIHAYTGGYPFLVSRICQHIDGKLGGDWTVGGVNAAVQMMLEEKNTLFDDMFKNIRSYKKLSDLLFDVLLVGRKIPFNIDDEVIALGHMFGYLKNANGQTKVANRIFEQRIYNYYVLQQIREEGTSGLDSTKYAVTRNGGFDMELCLRRFAEHYAEVTSKRDIEFLERHGRLLFLSYLKPLINGEGYYHVETEISDYRMDVVVDYGREQFIVELKIWRGERYEEEAYVQLAGYMEAKRAAVGYLLTFDFRKGQNKEPRAEWVEFGGKKIFEVIV